MPVQDRTGDDYEQILAASLVHLGYEFQGTVGKNYLHPPKRSTKIVIPDTFIQPDLVVRENEEVQAIIYVTHWSNTRDSKRKFWRTWEEAAQQKLVLGDKLLTINCVFEALPTDAEPSIYINSDELPIDITRQKGLPIQLNGWDPGIAWAMLEAFDISIIFPVGYAPVFQLNHAVIGEHDPTTSQLLSDALSRSVKTFFDSQWKTLGYIRKRILKRLPELSTTRSRYRIGLLHVYLFYRLVGFLSQGQPPPLKDFVKSLVNTYREQIELDELAKARAFSTMERSDVHRIFELLSNIYVRRGKKAKTFCDLIPGLSHNGISRYRVKFNKDLSLCLQDLATHINEAGFVEAIQRSFERFDSAYGLDEAIDDLASPDLVIAKEAFVRQYFANALKDEEQLKQLLHSHAKQVSPERKSISNHQQNWVFEMLLYMTGLNSAEDIQKRFKEVFEKSGHKVRPHAPYGGHAQTVAFLLQGRDICEQWKDPRSSKNKRTLNEDQFRNLSWDTVAQCIVQAFRDHKGVIKDADLVIKKYSENKSMRFISSDLNGFYIMIDYYLGDLCLFKFAENEDEEEEQEELDVRICQSWHTDVIQSLWGSKPLETWLEGVSHSEQWLIKIQSAQDGNQGHKTKELAGRCRGMHLSWSHGGDPHNRLDWKFHERVLPKLALVLDGDWDDLKKRNLYEAGWDWVGDVSQLGQLRHLIQAQAEFSFQDAAQYVVQKNTELYRRLA